MDPLKEVRPTTLIKIGSALIHAEEALSSDPHPFDVDTFRMLLIEPDVQEWLAAMSALALLPVKRR